MLAGIRCPALIVCGERDHLTPPSVARRMAETIPGAEYLKLAGATHFGLIERVGELDARLAAFVDRVWGGAEPPVP